MAHRNVARAVAILGCAVLFGACATTGRGTGAGDAEFVAVAAGIYTVGEANHPRNPLREVRLEAFRIATTETTNRQFTRFVNATGYVTTADEFGFGMTFTEGMPDWEWDKTPGANWRFPFGPGRPGAAELPDHPVTQISWRDAQAYCAWAGGRLPTLEEWEVAARAGAEGRMPWGEEAGTRANYWQGPSHFKDTGQDGFLYTAPVKSFPPNAWGLYDVIGNVFEYCADPGVNPVTGETLPLATGRGGSWWCSENTCCAYNLVDIGQMERDASFANQGFRCVKD